MIYEKSTLDVVASRMRVFAQDNPSARGKSIGPYRRKLARGLEITFLLDEQGWYLEIARIGIAPSAQEETIIRRYFAVPENAERDARSNAIVGSKYMRYAVRWRWKAEAESGEPPNAIGEPNH